MNKKNNNNIFNANYIGITIIGRLWDRRLILNEIIELVFFYTNPLLHVNVSDKYDNLADNSQTLDRISTRHYDRTSVCKISLVNCDYIASHNEEKSRAFNGLISI